MINESIYKLVNYAVSTGLISEEDRIYITNRVIDYLNINDYEDCLPENNSETLEEILESFVNYAVSNNLIEDNIVSKDLFDTGLMGILTPKPSEVIRKFNEKYSVSQKSATDFFYNFSQDTDYIRRYRVKKDVKWVTSTVYGDLDITINLSKPEKDPKSIAAEKLAPPSGYPKCLLCTENVGYAGRVNHPARQNHRIIPLSINGEAWGLQYSPYVYYNEHCIVFNQSHKPMEINETAFSKLFDFVKLFPHYFIGSNADLPIVGGSILSHEHFQGGYYKFAMEKAPITETFTISEFEEVKVGIVKWPMSVIRLVSKNTSELIKLGGRILAKWREYSDSDVGIFAYTDDTPHNTITPIARFNGSEYELDLVLRNNLTTDEHPLGVFHPHADLHHIKKENIGLIEVMGLAVLPARLKTELGTLGEYLVNGLDYCTNEDIKKHSAWANDIISKYSDINYENINEILQAEVGKVFERVLCDAGVFKQDDAGQNAFRKFIHSV